MENPGNILMWLKIVSVLVVLFSALVSLVGSYLGNKFAVRYHDKIIDGHTNELTEVFNRVNQCVTKDNCRDWRKEHRTDIAEIKQQIRDVACDVKSMENKVDENHQSLQASITDLQRMIISTLKSNGNKTK